jgi:hypothetical protein
LNDSKIPAFSDGEWLGKFSMYTHSSTKVMNMVTNYKGDAGFLSLDSRKTSWRMGVERKLLLHRRYPGIR